MCMCMCMCMCVICMCMCVMCDVYVHVCDVYVHVCDVYVYVCDVYVHVCDVYVYAQLVQMEVHISLLRKGCVRGGASTLDLDQYATKVYLESWTLVILYTCIYIYQILLWFVMIYKLTQTTHVTNALSDCTVSPASL